MYWVYVIWNHTLHQIYIGISNDVESRWAKHRSGGVKTTAVWFKNGHEVDFRRLPNSNFSTASEASAYAHYAEREGKAKGYKIIETRGL